MIATSPELQQQIHRLSCLDGYTRVGAAEIEAMLCKWCENEAHAYAVIQYFIDGFREYPRPVEARQIAFQMGPPIPSMVSIHDPACPRCGGTGFTSELRTVDGLEVSFSRRCHGPSIMVERTTSEYPAFTERTPITAEEQAVIHALFTAEKVKDVPPPAPPTADPDWLIRQEDPDRQPKIVINAEAAALKKAAEIEELLRRFGHL